MRHKQFKLFVVIIGDHSALPLQIELVGVSNLLTNIFDKSCLVLHDASGLLRLT